MRKFRIKHKGISCNSFSDCEKPNSWGGCVGTAPTPNPEDYVLKTGSTMTGCLLLQEGCNDPASAVRQDELDAVIAELGSLQVLLADNRNGTYTIAAGEEGDADVIDIDTRAISNPFDPTGTELISTNVQDAILEINTLRPTSLGELTDVDLSQMPVTDGDILVYCEVEENWVNEPIDTVLSAITFTVERIAHPFTDDDRGAPMALINDEWDFAIANDMSSVHTAVFLNVVDLHTIRLQQGGVVEDIHASVIGDTGMIAGEIYRTSEANAGTVIQGVPSSGTINDPVYQALDNTSGILTQYKADPNLPLDANNIVQVVQIGHGFTTDNIGSAVATDGIDWYLTNSTSQDDSAIGLISEIIDVDTFVLMYSGTLTNISPTIVADGGSPEFTALETGKRYRVSPTDTGKLTSIEGGENDLVQYVLYAISESTGTVNVEAPYTITTPLGTSILEGTDNEVDGLKMSVVTTLPGTPDANTIYFVTG